MLRYVVRRLLTGCVTLVGITLLTFCVIRLAPGDPALLQAAVGDHATVDYEELRQYFGLDRPLFEQYGSWVARLATGDFGYSFDNTRVVDKILPRLWPTLSVSFLSLFVAFLVSVPLGLMSSARPGGAFDRSTSVFLYVLYSIPSYVMGILLVRLFSVEWQVLPIHDMRSDGWEHLGFFDRIIDSAKHYVLITFCSAYASVAYYSRFVRQNLLEVVREDYVRAARAKGASEARVFVRHAFVNTLIPFITLVGLTLPFVLSGSVILEYLFDWPGLGQLYFDSVRERDYPTLMALNFVTAVLVLVSTLLTDLAYGFVDPRVSHE